MILATSSQEPVVFHPGRSSRPRDAEKKPQDRSSEPLTQKEIEDYSRIKCSVCGECVEPDDIVKHSRKCALNPVPNHVIQLDKWCIASAGMTPHEQRLNINMRRKEELARVDEIEQKLKRPSGLWWMPGSFGFVISSEWLRNWRSFVGVGKVLSGTKDRPPPPIHNSELFGLDGRLKMGLQEGLLSEFRVIEQPLWEFYFQVYGGGPVILRYNNAGLPPAMTDEPLDFTGDWHDRRPHTGVGKAFDPYSGFGFDGEIRDGFLWNCRGKGLLRDGSHYDGTVKNGLPEGKGRLVTPSGVIRDGVFVDGKLHGNARTIHPNGLEEEGEWVHGVLCGI